MKNKAQIFNSLLDAFKKHLEQIVVLSIDNFLMFDEPEELELLIRNDVSRYCLAKELILPSDVFAKPDNPCEFEPATSDYEVAFVYKIFTDFSLVVQLKIQVNRVDRLVFIDQLTTGSISITGKWYEFKDAYKNHIMTFDKVSLLRDCEMKGETI